MPPGPRCLDRRSLPASASIAAEICHATPVFVLAAAEAAFVMHEALAIDSSGMRATISSIASAELAARSVDAPPSVWYVCIRDRGVISVCTISPAGCAGCAAQSASLAAAAASSASSSPSSTSSGISSSTESSTATESPSTSSSDFVSAEIGEGVLEWRSGCSAGTSTTGLLIWSSIRSSESSSRCASFSSARAASPRNSDDVTISVSSSLRLSSRARASPTSSSLST
mmetsp:Transcript_48126/g.111460  ORF Transcript_48126/g.111460 Transcript_48126/m.111460 type:complete len:228 (+) Transcript_48126:150-833(+)